MHNNIDEIKKKYFKDETELAKKLFLAINVFSITIWILAIMMILRTKQKRMMYILTIISGIGVSIIFLERLIGHLADGRNIDMHLGADYRVCQTGPDGLTNKEIKNGAIGIIDYDCSIDAWRTMTSIGEGYRTGAYYITYTIFALVLTHIKIRGKSDKFLTQIIRYLLLFGILAITASRYCTEWVLSIFSLTIASNFTIMMTVLASLLLINIISTY